MNAQALLFLLMPGTPYMKMSEKPAMDKMDTQALLFLLMPGTPYMNMSEEPANG